MVDASQAQAAITKAENFVNNQLPSTLEDLRQKFEDSFLSKIPMIGDAIGWLWNKILDLADKVRQKVSEMLKNARVPFIFDEYDDKWIQIHKKMKGDGGVAATLQLNVDGSEKFWGGDAGGAYKEGVSRQPTAADSIGSTASSIAAACTSIRNAGFTFYIAMAAALVLVIVALATAAAPPAAIAALIGCLVSIGVAVAGLLIQVNTGKKSLEEVKGGGSTFAGGWPKAKVG